MAANFACQEEHGFHPQITEEGVEMDGPGAVYTYPPEEIASAELAEVQARCWEEAEQLVGGDADD
ncbi:MAG TPA: hypothetical protein VIL36_23545 [Acidimicrobiales bacterium]